MGLDASVVFNCFLFCLQYLPRCTSMPFCVVKYFPHSNSQLICAEVLDVSAGIVWIDFILAFDFAASETISVPIESFIGVDASVVVLFLSFFLQYLPPCNFMPL